MYCHGQRFLTQPAPNQIEIVGDFAQQRADRVPQAVKSQARLDLAAGSATPSSPSPAML